MHLFRGKRILTRPHDKDSFACFAQALIRPETALANFFERPKTDGASNAWIAEYPDGQK